MTQTSQKENTGTLLLDSSKAAMTLVDLPGYDRLRSQFIEKYASTARALIFVVDSSAINKEIKDVAEWVKLVGNQSLWDFYFLAYWVFWFSVAAPQGASLGDFLLALAYPEKEALWVGLLCLTPESKTNKIVAKDMQVFPWTGNWGSDLWFKAQYAIHWAIALRLWVSEPEHLGFCHSDWQICAI